MTDDSGTDDSRRWEFEAGVPNAGVDFPGSYLRRLHVPGSAILPPLGARSLPPRREDLETIPASATAERMAMSAPPPAATVPFLVPAMVGAAAMSSSLAPTSVTNLGGDVPRGQKGKKVRGWLWAVLVPSLALVAAGAVATLAVDGAGDYAGRGRGADEPAALAQLGHGIARCGERTRRLPQSSDWVPANAVQSKKHRSQASDWTSQSAFACAGFALARPQPYQYRWELHGARQGTAWARADLDGDGQVEQVWRCDVACRDAGCEVGAIHVGSAVSQLKTRQLPVDDPIPPATLRE